jgi:glycerol-3-phosphate dehydrogenase
MSAAAGLRNSNLARLAGEEFDVLIVGAGINGAVSAAALATQGARVALVDRGDFAGFTSSQSSNLAWGGIKYLENYEFPLVRDLCMSRNELLRSYPSSVREIRFLTNVAEGFRHRPWQMLLGSWLYWLMGNGFTRTPRMLSREQVAREEPVVRARGLAGSIEYSDAYLYDNDSRFVFKFVRSALDRGAAAANYVESLGSERRDGMWHTQLRDVTTEPSPMNTMPCPGSVPGIGTSTPRVSTCWWNGSRRMREYWPFSPMMAACSSQFLWGRRPVWVPLIPVLTTRMRGSPTPIAISCSTTSTPD